MKRQWLVSRHFKHDGQKLGRQHSVMCDYVEMFGPRTNALSAKKKTSYIVSHVI